MNGQLHGAGSSGCRGSRTTGRGTSRGRSTARARSRGGPMSRVTARGSGGRTGAQSGLTAQQVAHAAPIYVATGVPPQENRATRVEEDRSPALNIAGPPDLRMAGGPDLGSLPGSRCDDDGQLKHADSRITNAKNNTTTGSGKAPASSTRGDTDVAIEPATGSGTQTGHRGSATDTRAAVTRGKGSWANIVLKGRCMGLFDVASNNMDDYTAVLNGQKRHATEGKRFLSAHRLISAVVIAASDFIPCLFRKELLAETPLKALDPSLLVTSVLEGQLTKDAVIIISQSGTGPASPRVIELVASELRHAESQIVRIMKRLRDHFMKLQSSERTSLSGATIQDQRQHWLAFSNIPEDWEWPQFDAFIASVKQNLGSVTTIGATKNSTDNNPRQESASRVRRNISSSVEQEAEEERPLEGLPVEVSPVHVPQAAQNVLQVMEDRRTPGRPPSEPIPGGSMDDAQNSSPSSAGSLMDDHAGELQQEYQDAGNDDMSDDILPASVSTRPSSVFPEEGATHLPLQNDNIAVQSGRSGAGAAASSMPAYAPSDRAQLKVQHQFTMQRKKLLKKRSSASQLPPRQPRPQRSRREQDDPSSLGSEVARLLQFQNDKAERDRASDLAQNPRVSTEGDSGSGRQVMSNDTFTRSMHLLKEYRNDPNVSAEDLRTLLVTMAGCTEEQAVRMVPSD